MHPIDKNRRALLGNWFTHAHLLRPIAGTPLPLPQKWLDESRAALAACAQALRDIGATVPTSIEHAETLLIDTMHPERLSPETLRDIFRPVRDRVSIPDAPWDELIANEGTPYVRHGYAISERGKTLQLYDWERDHAVTDDTTAVAFRLLDIDGAVIDEHGEDPEHALLCLHKIAAAMLDGDSLESAYRSLED
jgi:hypothetical protein